MNQSAEPESPLLFRKSLELMMMLSIKSRSITTKAQAAYAVDVRFDSLSLISTAVVPLGIEPTTFRSGSDYPCHYTRVLNQLRQLVTRTSVADEPEC